MMKVVDIKSLALSEAVEIKLEDIESEPEDLLKQTQKSLLNSQKASKITSKDRNEPHSKIYYHSGDEEDSEDCEDEDFQYVCNTVNESIEFVNINENPSDRKFESGGFVTEVEKMANNAQSRTVPFKLLEESIHKTSGTIMEKPMEMKAVLLINMSRKDGDTINQVQEMVNSAQVKRTVHVNSLDELTGKTNSIKVVREGQNIEKPLEIKVTLLNGGTGNGMQPVINNSQIRTVLIKPLDELSGKTNGRNVLNGNKKDDDTLSTRTTKYFTDPKVHDDEIITKDQGYQCAYCSYLSTSWHHIKHHIRFLHRTTGLGRKRKRRLRQCPYCPVQSTRLDGHIYNCHTDPEDISWFYCNHCGYKAKIKSTLESHIMAKHTNPSLYEHKVCKKCGKRFRNHIFLNKHIKRVHHPEWMKHHQCDFCAYTTISKSMLKDHMSRHISFEDGFKCSKCSFTAKKVNELTKHQRIEHLEWIQCHICAYKCKDNFRLKLHLIHHQEKKEEEDLSYKCQKCDYKTYRRYNLTVHMLKHKKPDEIEMFQCYHCNFKAKRKDNLKTHIFKHDLYKTILGCFICSFKTSSKYELKRHVDVHSEEQKKAKLMNDAKTKKDKRMDEGTKRNDENKNKTRNILNDNQDKSQKKSEEKKLLETKGKTLDKQRECTRNNKVINRNQILVGECMKMNENENQRSVVENATKMEQK